MSPTCLLGSQFARRRTKERSVACRQKRGSGQGRGLSYLQLFIRACVSYRRFRVPSHRSDKEVSHPGACLETWKSTCSPERISR
ncbi:hypothetical protein AVEN_210469-1, partial [Araneus ventricosus]